MRLDKYRIYFWFRELSTPPPHLYFDINIKENGVFLTFGIRSFFFDVKLPEERKHGLHWKRSSFVFILY